MKNYITNDDKETIDEEKWSCYENMSMASNFQDLKKPIFEEEKDTSKAFINWFSRSLGHRVETASGRY